MSDLKHLQSSCEQLGEQLTNAIVGHHDWLDLKTCACHHPAHIRFVFALNQACFSPQSYDIDSLRQEAITLNKIG